MTKTDKDVLLLNKIADGLSNKEAEDLRSIARELTHLRNVSTKYFGDAGFEHRAMAALEDKVKKELELDLPNFALVAQYLLIVNTRRNGTMNAIGGGLSALASLTGGKH